MVMERLEVDGHSEELKTKRCQVLNGLWEGYKSEEVKWRQKSRVTWLKEGDRNTSFFHFVSKIRRSKNHISRIQVNDQVIENPSLIKDAIRNHFHSFFTSDHVQRPKLKCPNLVKLSMKEKDELESSFTEAEIWEVIKNFDGDKAPGPDGFNFTFFKHFWHLIKEDIIRFLRNFT